MIKKEILDTQICAHQVALFYLGQEGYLFKFRDRHILIDPYLSDYVDRHCCSDAVIWKRRYEPPVSPSLLDFVDYVFCTHEHFDHMDPSTLSAIYKANNKTIFVVPAPSEAVISSYGIPASNIVGARAGQPLSLDGIVVRPIPSAHEELQKDPRGDYLHLGYHFTFGDITLYHAGDCCLYDGLSSSIMDTDVLMLPINGRGFYKLQGDIIGNMNMEEALLLSLEVKADMIIPMHYDLYDVNCVNPAHFVDLLYNRYPSLKFHMFIPGERFIYCR